MNAKQLWDAYGEKLHRSKKEFYRGYKLLFGKSEEFDQAEFDKMFPATQEKCRYSSPSWPVVRKQALDELMEGFGWEPLDPSETRNGYEMQYINFEDPYIPTVVYCYGWQRRYKFCPAGWAQFVKS